MSAGFKVINFFLDNYLRVKMYCLEEWLSQLNEMNTNQMNNISKHNVFSNIFDSNCLFFAFILRFSKKGFHQTQIHCSVYIWNEQ